MNVAQRRRHLLHLDDLDTVQVHASSSQQIAICPLRRYKPDEDVSTFAEILFCRLRRRIPAVRLQK